MCLSILINSATNCRAQPIPSLGQKTRNQRGKMRPHHERVRDCCAISKKKSAGI
jgi:hypothetical protein